MTCKEMIFMLYIIFHGTPIVLLGWFILSLCRYLIAKRQNRQEPGRFSADEIKQRRFMLILSGSMLAAFFLVIFGFIAMLYNSVAYM